MPAMFAALEAIERDAWLDVFAAAPAAFVEQAGLAFSGQRGAARFAIRAAPTIEFNRCQGLGVEAAASQAEVDASIVWLRAHCNEAWALQVAPDAAPSELAGWIEARGLRRYGAGWAKFQRRRDAAPASSTTLDVRLVGPDRAGDFGAVVQGGFGAPPPFALWAAAVVGRPKWRAYVGYDGQTPAVAGALYIDDAIGWLGMGAALPAFRGRGGQTALLNRRIADGAAAGVTTFVTETGVPPAGEEAKHPSWRNIRRAGFEVAYVRANYHLAV